MILMIMMIYHLERTVPSESHRKHFHPKNLRVRVQISRNRVVPHLDLFVYYLFYYYYLFIHYCSLQASIYMVCDTNLSQNVFLALVFHEPFVSPCHLSTWAQLLSSLEIAQPQYFFASYEPNPISLPDTRFNQSSWFRFWWFWLWWLQRLWWLWFWRLWWFQRMWWDTLNSSAPLEDRTSG